MRGGDTDTNGAIAGALLGTVHGRDAVPARWTTDLLSCRPLAESGTRHPMPVEFWPCFWPRRCCTRTTATRSTGGRRFNRKRW